MTTRANRAMPPSSRRSAASTAATSTATWRSPRWSPTRTAPNAGYGIAAYVDGLQSAGRIEEALARTEDAVAAARGVGNPYWVAYSLWIAGMAFSHTDARRAFAAWDEGMAVVREHRVHFFEGFVAAADVARLHTSAGDVEAALVLFADAVGAFQRLPARWRSS